MQIKENLLKAGYKISDELESAISKTFETYKVNTRLKQVHFLAQIIHESQALKRVEENLNYSADRLLVVFPKYFNSTTAKQYQRNSTAIGSRVYANRMGNGAETSMDGYTYRGRGFIMNTGKSQYELLTKEFGVDFVSNPDLLKQLPYSMLSAGFYWYRNNLNILAEQDKIKEITKRINGGYIGLDDRIKILNKLKKVF
jgi:putative chitinase